MESSQVNQSRITNVIAEVAVMMLEYGAESRLIEQVSTRIGVALGCPRVELGLIPSTVSVTTLLDTSSVTTTRQSHSQSLNMSIVHDILQLCIQLEAHPVNLDAVEKRVQSLKPRYYPRWVLIPFIGLACAAFSHLHGADWNGFVIAFIAAAIGMWVRVSLAKRNYPGVIVFAATAFVSTVIASISLYHDISRTPNIVISASVLLLVPGFPFVNAFLDAFKGYLIMGWGRWLQASLLTLMTSLGIMLAAALLHLDTW